jgi:hypothetical protein
MGRFRWACALVETNDCVTGSCPERESNPRLSVTRPMLYPTELSSGAACRTRTCDPRLRKPVLCSAELMPQSRKPSGAGIGIRHGSAARTGRDSSPYRCCQSSLVSALPPRERRQSRVARRRARRHAGVLAPLRMPGNENAPGFASEGIRIASEDRNDRPPARGRSADGVALPARESHIRSRSAQGLRGCAVAGDVAWVRHGLFAWFSFATIAKGAHLTPRFSKAQGVRQKILAPRAPTPTAWPDPGAP